MFRGPNTGDVQVTETKVMLTRMHNVENAPESVQNRPRK